MVARILKARRIRFLFGRKLGSGPDGASSQPDTRSAALATKESFEQKVKAESAKLGVRCRGDCSVGSSRQTRPDQARGCLWVQLVQLVQKGIDLHPQEPRCPTEPRRHEAFTLPI